MPLTTRRGSWLGRPVRGFSGGSSGSSRCHCASVTSKRLISPTWAGLPQSATLCRHALAQHFAAKTPFKTRIAHGLYTASLISAVLGTRLPGPGAVYISQTLNFRAPVRIGDTVHVQVEVVELIPERHRARLACTCRVGEEVVLDGEALIKVPSAANSPPLLHPYSCHEPKTSA